MKKELLVFREVDSCEDCIEILLKCRKMVLD